MGSPLSELLALLEGDGTDDSTMGAFRHPDGSGNRGGNPAASRTTSREPSFPYDRPVSYGNQFYYDASGPTDGDIPGDAADVWEDEVPSLADHFGVKDDERERKEGLHALLSNNLCSDR